MLLFLVTYIMTSIIPKNSLSYVNTPQMHHCYYDYTYQSMILETLPLIIIIDINNIISHAMDTKIDYNVIPVNEYNTLQSLYNYSNTCSY